MLRRLPPLCCSSLRVALTGSVYMHDLFVYRIKDSKKHIMLTFNPPTGSLCLQVAVGSVSVLRTLTKWHVDGRRLVSIDQAAASLENKAEDPRRVGGRGPKALRVIR